MDKKTEKRLNFLLDKLLLRITSGDNLLQVNSTTRDISKVLDANNAVLPDDLQEKILQILPLSHSFILISPFRNKDYRHLSDKIVKLLDLNDLFFSNDIIVTLYKMGTYQYEDEIYPFSILSMEDRPPFSENSYRTMAEACFKLPQDWFFKKYHKCNRTWEFYSRYRPSGDFQWLNDTAKKYIKRAKKLKAKHTSEL